VTARPRRTRGAVRGKGAAGKRARLAPTTPLDYEAKHVELLQAAATLFAERGFHDASVRDLARATGRSLSGLYYYFTTKEELLFQIQHHCYGTLLATVKEAIGRTDTPREMLVTFIRHHLTYFRHNMNEMKVLAHEDLTLTGDYGGRILEIKRQYSRVLIDIVTELEQDLPPRPERPSPEVTAFLLFGAMNWLYTWPRRVRQLSAEELTASVAHVFLQGYPGAPTPAAPERREAVSAAAVHGFWREGVVLAPQIAGNQEDSVS
jgi:AcrR family transcriptional regulator